jgi:plastocyanin domain-containing protein
VKVPQGQPVILEFTRETESECLNAVRMPWLSDTIPLPMNKLVGIPFDASKPGTITYACWMNMIFGKITVTPR